MLACWPNQVRTHAQRRRRESGHQPEVQFHQTAKSASLYPIGSNFIAIMSDTLERRSTSKGQQGERLGST